MNNWYSQTHGNVLALRTGEFTFIVTEEEFSIEQLDSYDSKNKLKEYVHNKNVDHIFKRIYNTVKDCFQLWNSLDSF